MFATQWLVFVLFRGGRGVDGDELSDLSRDMGSVLGYSIYPGL